ncbi:MAG: ABC transporter permease [Acidimicrobiia bacterium]
MGRVTLRGLFAHKLRFLLTAIAIVLGVSFVTGTLIFTDTVRRTFDSLFADVFKGTDAYVRARSSLSSNFGPDQRAKVPASVLGQVKSVDCVRNADGNIQIQNAQYLGRDGKPVGNPARGAPSLGFNWSTVPALNSWTLVEYGGKQSHPPRGPDEVVIDKGTADDEHWGVGDKATILFSNNPSIARATFTVAGVAKFGDVDRPAGATVALFTTARAQQLDNSVGSFDSISVTADPGVSQKELQASLRAALPKTYGVLTGAQITKENQNQVEQGLGFFTTFLLVFAFISLFVGAFIIVNTFSIVVAQRTRELALLRALGASGRQVRLSVIGEALTVGVVASAVGIGIGIAMSVGLRSLLSALGLEIPSTDLVIKSSSIVIGLAVGVIVTLVSAIFPARRAARVSPMAALRSVAVEERNLRSRTIAGAVIALLGVLALVIGLFGGGGIQLVGLGAFAAFLGIAILGPVIARPVGRVLGAPLPRLRGMAGNLARENAVRNPRRTASTAAALMIGVALVGLFSIFAASVKESISSQIDKSFKADFVVLHDGGGFGQFSPKIAEDIGKDPDVKVASGLRFAPLRVGGKDDFAVSSDPRTIGDLFDFQGRAGNIADLRANDIAVSTKAMKDHHWKLGQVIPARFPVGGVSRMKITATYKVGQQQGLSDYFLATSAYLKRYTDIADNQVYVKLNPGVDAKQAKPALDKIVKQFPGTKLTDQAGLKAQFETQVNQLLSIIFALLALALIIALVGIMNTLLLSIVERTREIGLLRAVGMSRRQVRSTVRWEAVIVAVFGALLGLAIGIALGWAVIRALKDQGFSAFAVPVGQLVLYVVVAGLAGVLAAAYPARRAARLDVLDAISTE